VDGAHNIDSATTLRAFIDSLGVQSGVHFIISLSSSPGKSPESVLRPLLRPDDEVTIMDFTTPVEGMPWVKPAIKSEVADVIRTMGSIEVDVQEIPGVEGLKRVLDQAAERFSAESVPRLTVICGSLYLVADVYRLLRS
jgi:folylpolyglutamate synthase